MASKHDNSKKARKRGDRLAAALRENLRRRKAQQRGRSDDSTVLPKPETETPPVPAVGSVSERE